MSKHMYMELHVHVVPLDGLEICARILQKNPSFFFLPSPSPALSSPSPSFLLEPTTPSPTELPLLPEVVSPPPPSPEAVPPLLARNLAKPYRCSLAGNLTKPR